MSKLTILFFINLFPNNQMIINLFYMVLHFYMI